MKPLFDIEQLRAMHPISSVVSQYVQLKPRGHQWQGCCPFHHDTNPSFSVCDEKGTFNCFGCGAAGDVFDFIQRLEGVGFREAAERIAGAQPPSLIPVIPRKADRSNSELALSIWRDAAPIAGTLAERYLANRGLKLNNLPPLPSLRFARLRHKDLAGYHPTLVAAITAPDGTICSIQRTYLAEPGVKLAVRDPKLGLGSCRGGAIRLGQSRTNLVVCEGLEDGLSILTAMPTLSVWVATGAGKMRSMYLPEECQQVTIAVDNDEASETAARAAREAFSRGNREVRIARPDPGFKDFNEQIQA